MKSVTVETPEVAQTDINRMKLCGIGLSYNSLTGNVASPTLTTESKQSIIGSNETQQAESIRCSKTEVTEQLDSSSDFLCRQVDLPAYSTGVLAFMSQIRMHTEKLTSLADPTGNSHGLAYNAFLSDSVASAREKKSARNTINVEDALGEVESRCTKMAMNIIVDTRLKWLPDILSFLANVMT